MALSLFLSRISHVKRSLSRGEERDEEEERGESFLSPSFWEEHRSSSLRTKSAMEAERLEKKLRRAVKRVAPCSSPPSSSLTTWVNEKGELCFDPFRLRGGGVKEEQMASLLVMHAHSLLHPSVSIRILLRDATWSSISSLLVSTSPSDAETGAILWTTLPSKVERVTVELPPSGKAKGFFSLVVLAGKTLLSPKMRKRVVFE